MVDDSRPPCPADYVERLDASVADGRPGDAVELFMTGAVGMPAEAIAGLRQSPFWPALGSRPHHRLRRPHHGRHDERQPF